ncbi:MAG TPA: 2-keto-4-pentenoate hydratase [Acidobacterium sp.]|nr:2-keto-4-pentenoate hydratase [Acidobacterium sp.]
MTQHADRLDRAAGMLVEARRTLSLLENLPVELCPRTLDEAYAVQDRVAALFGAVGGYKIGAPTPEAAPLFGPMPLFGPDAVAGGFPRAATGEEVLIGGPLRRMRGIEAEIAFLLGSDLPPRDTPYTREEVVAAIASAHPGLELLESAFVDPDKVERPTMMGDLQINGGYVLGPALPGWQSVDLTEESVKVTVDGEVRFRGTASNSAGTDLLRLVVYLANEGAARTGGLRAGQVITTGSWSGKTLAHAGSVARIEFSTFGGVKIRFA